MSKRKQAAIEAGKAAAITAKQQQTVPELKNRVIRQQWRKLLNGKMLAATGIGLLLTLGAIGASVGGSFSSASQQNKAEAKASWLGNLFSSPGAAPAVVMPTPGLQLSKEYIYAGSRMLAVEDAGSPNSATQPADLVVWRPTSGTWYIKDSGNGTTSTGVFGMSGDLPVLGDFDGDGLYDFAVFRSSPPNGSWYVLPSGGGSFYSLQFGLSSDVPAPVDYDGDGRADIAVWRRSNSTFYILRSSNNVFQSVLMSSIPAAETLTTPVSADYDGDGAADPALYRGALLPYTAWAVKRSTDGAELNQTWGDSNQGDVPTPGDYDGDGKIDLAVCRKTSGQNVWYITPFGSTASYTKTISITSAADDRPVAGDYDGDGKTDPAVWRNSTGYWYIQNSISNTLRSDLWGAAGDVPVPAPMKR